MPEYQIIKTRKDGPDPDRRIDAVMLADGSIYNVDRIIEFIKAGHTFCVHIYPRPPVQVYIQRHRITQREYLTTSPDGLGVNNLLNLPDC